MILLLLIIVNEHKKFLIINFTKKEPSSIKEDGFGFDFLLMM
jgi:hypothetical protein